MKEEGSNYVKRTQKDYSYNFKLQVVAELESGIISQRGAMLKYGIQSRSTVRNWLDKYGTLDRRYKQERMKKSPEQELIELRQEVAMLKKQKKLLEKQVDMGNKKAAFFDMMVDIAEEELSIDIRKKYSTQASKHIEKKQKKA